MTGNYVDASQAVIDALIAAFPDELNVENTLDGELDKVVDYLNTVQGSTMGCYIEFLRAEQTSPRPFQTYIWDDSIMCTLILRVDLETIEDETKSKIDTLRRLFLSDRRLGGVASIATVTLIDKPVQAKIGEEPFQWIPFIVTVKSLEIR